MPLSAVELPERSCSEGLCRRRRRRGRGRRRRRRRRDNRVRICALERKGTRPREEREGLSCCCPRGARGAEQRSGRARHRDGSASSFSCPSSPERRLDVRVEGPQARHGASLGGARPSQGGDGGDEPRGGLGVAGGGLGRSEDQWKQGGRRRRRRRRFFFSFQQRQMHRGRSPELDRVSQGSPRAVQQQRREAQKRRRR